ncbi:MAG: DUF362 domain-containing protein [Chloroflexi bacterium]|nr:MAG: DUF362 domain-containing protein [Chloroflexota bacterium]
MRKLSRRKLLIVSGATAASALLNAAGCAPSPQSQPVEKSTSITATDVTAAAPSATQAPAATEAENPTAAPTETPPNPQMTFRRPEIIQFYPAVKSRVIHARSADAWQGDKLSPDALRKMVDTSIVTLTGKEDTKSAWLALFDPGERIAIKVNAFRNSTIWTHPELVYAVTDSLQEAGIPAEQITIFDYWDNELETAGYKLNKDGPGVRCYGTEDAYTTRWRVAANVSCLLSDILMNTDALINIPVLKSHMIAGMTFALKNHYGSVQLPDRLHNIAKCLPGLSTLAPIKDATRLVIGDVLSANTKYSDGWPYWEPDYQGDSILMSYDPLAHDTVGYEMLLKLAEEKGNPTEYIIGMAKPWFQTCGDAGIGANDMSNIELVEV